MQILSASHPSPASNVPAATPRTSRAHVVALVNFLAPNLVPVMRALSGQVGKLTILVSVPMESNRHWSPSWDGLQVRVQRTKTLTRHFEHPGGYREVNYIHLPYATPIELSRLQPDVIVSAELGARTSLAALYRRFHRDCRLITCVAVSQRTEAGRGRTRTWLRQQLLAASDLITYNSPSCRRYLESLGCHPGGLMPWDYAANPAHVQQGEIHPFPDAHASMRLLTVGQWIERKGIVPAAKEVIAWAARHTESPITWTLVGGGPQQAELASLAVPHNLTVKILEHSGPEQLRHLYATHEALLFPTLADEWGLVVDEALASGLVVLGSRHAQAVEVLVAPGENGWAYTPGSGAGVQDLLDLWHATSSEQRLTMRRAARSSVASRTPERSAMQLARAIEAVLADRQWSVGPAGIATGNP